METAWRFTREFGDENKTVIHNLDIAQATGYHPPENPIVRDDALLERSFSQIFSTLDRIDLSRKQFIWLHLPHIIKGRRSYLDDMDALDHIVGYVRELVGDDNIFLTTDHGHMNMHKGKVGYGFDVYEPVIRIPLISPKVDGRSEVTDLTCNIDFPSLLLEHRIIRREFVVSDTAYYAQSYRKTAVVTERFKYIYNKQDKSEELYDLTWDSEENYNILKYDYRDRDRKKRIVYNELYFYPYREEALAEEEKLHQIRDSMWREAPLWYVWYGGYERNYHFKKVV